MITAINSKKMRKSSFITHVLSIILVLFFTLEQANAQKGMPFYLAYDSEDVIRDQAKVATITSTGGLIINGVEVKPWNMRSANTSAFKKQIVNADVLPGTYEVAMTHSPSGEDLRVRTNAKTDPMTGITTTTITTVDLVPITYNFEAGHVYVVEMHLFTIFRIREITKEKTIAKIAETRNNAVFENKKKY